MSHFERLAAAARASRVGEPGSRRRSRPSSSPAARTRGCTRTRAIDARSPSFLAAALGGPLDPATAGEIAAETQAMRIPDLEAQFEAVDELPGGLRTLAQVALPGATRPPRSREAPPSPRRRTRADPRVVIEP